MPMLGLSERSVSNILFWVTRKKWLILSFFFSISFFYMPSPDGLHPEGHRTLIIVIVALILIVSESIPLPAVAILILIMEELGDEWIQPNLLRIGASSLLIDIERQLYHHAFGRYATKDKLAIS